VGGHIYSLSIEGLDKYKNSKRDLYSASIKSLTIAGFFIA
jgi:hypothetical protein